jgi:hypothetical protein
MSNYTKSTNFATKDALASGNPLKIVKGTEIDTEFNNIATAIATKADLASPTFTGTPAAPTASASTNTTQVATTAFVQAAISLGIQALHPVGSIYTAVVSTNPATLLGFGTWSAFGAGRVMVGFDSSNALFDTAEETGGSADAITVSHTHTATTTITDSGHTHTANVPNEFATGTVVTSGLSSSDGLNSLGKNVLTSSSTTGITAATTVASSGSSGTNANYQPYITVYMWKRVS